MSDRKHTQTRVDQGKREEAPTPRYTADWKRLGGQGQQATFRVTCGSPRCPESLGRFLYYDLTQTIESGARFKMALTSGTQQEEASAKFVTARDLRERTSRGEVPNVTGWRMEPEPKRGKGPRYYRGYADSYYEIRTRDQDDRHGRRAKLPQNATERELRRLGFDSARAIAGQVPVPPCVIKCPSPNCGELSKVVISEKVRAIMDASEWDYSDWGRRIDKD